MTDLIPITDEQAKAIQEVAKVGGQSLEIVTSLGGYFARVLGTVPEDIVGILGGDALRVRRVENAARRVQDAKARLDSRNVQSEPPPLSLLGPILNPASEEERPELTDLWSRLLAAAMDPARVGKVRQAFMDTLKRMDPMDALVLEALGANIQTYSPGPVHYLSSHLGTGQDEIELSLFHLFELDVLRERMTARGDPVRSLNQVDYTVFGRELMRTLRD
jgi:hypothetical protein